MKEDLEDKRKINLGKITTVEARGSKVVAVKRDKFG